MVTWPSSDALYPTRAATLYWKLSLGCALSGGFASLVAFRVLQGVGGGMMTPVGTAMLFRAFPPARRAKASQVLIIPTVIAPALGPIIGGWLAEGFEDVITVDPHLHRISHLSEAVPARNAVALGAAPAFVEESGDVIGRGDVREAARGRLAQWRRWRETSGG